jgi:hypothetical protein
MASLGSLNRSGTVKRYIFWPVACLLGVCFVVCALWYWFLFAPEVRESDRPLTLQEAMQRAETRLPVPSTARNIYFHLSGKTQNWDLYVCFEAPLKDTEEQVQREFHNFDWDLAAIKSSTSIEARQKFQDAAEPEQGWTKYERQKITESTIPADVRRKAPSWWMPEKLEHGYFVGSMRADGYGPRFWVDPKTGKVFYYEHYD